MQALKAKIRHVPDFPKAGILFYDVTTLLRDPEGFKLAVDALASPYANADIALVVGIESRGFILGAAVADRLARGVRAGAQSGETAVGHGAKDLRPRVRDRQPRDRIAMRSIRASGSSSWTICSPPEGRRGRRSIS